MPGTVRTENGCAGWGQASLWPGTVSFSSQKWVPGGGQKRKVVTFPPKTLPASTNLSLKDCSSPMRFMCIFNLFGFPFWELVQASLEPIDALNSDSTLWLLNYVIFKDLLLLLFQLPHLSSCLHFLSWQRLCTNRVREPLCVGCFSPDTFIISPISLLF